MFKFTDLLRTLYGGAALLVRSKKAAVGLPVAAAFLFVACTSGAPASRVADSLTAPGSTVDTQTSGSAGSTARSAEAAPNFEIVLFQNQDHGAGEALILADLVGRPVVVNFWFPSCPPCVAEMPDLEKSYQEHKADVEFIGVQLIGLDSVADGQEFVNQLGVNYAIGADENATIFQDYKIAGFPTTVFLNRDHSISRSWTGILNEEKLDEFVQQILN